MKNGTQSILNFFLHAANWERTRFWIGRLDLNTALRRRYWEKKLKLIYVCLKRPFDHVWITASTNFTVPCISNSLARKRKENQISRFLLCPSFKLWTIEGHKYIPRKNLSLAFPTTIHIVVWSFSRRIASYINHVVYERMLIFYSWPQDAIAHFFPSVLHVRFHMAYSFL